jgi:perosamine synthetase
MNNKMKQYPLFKVHIDKNSALKHLGDVFDSGFMSEGEPVTQFVEKVRPYIGHHNIVPLNSCTSALTIALRCAGIKSGDSVISPSLTCVATNMPIATCGASIDWAEIDPNTGTIDPQDVERQIRATTKAVIAVSWAGNPPALRELGAICNKYNIKLIHDAAHAFGATYRKIKTPNQEWHDLPIANWSDFTTFSLQAIKHISTGDGGLLTCRSKDDYVAAEKMKWFGMSRLYSGAKDKNGNWLPGRAQWDAPIDDFGFKFNMNNVAAAIGLSQIPHIEKILAAHRENALVYDSLFADNPYVKPLVLQPSSGSSRWVYTIVLREDLPRDKVLQELNSNGIHAGVVHVPNHHYTCFKDFYRELPRTDNFAAHQFSLPCGWWLNKEDILFIFDKLMEICKKY